MDCTNINLKKGSKGDKVKELQTLLKKINYYDGKLDGDFGSYTEQSVKNYQKSKSLLQDGIFGPVTCKKLHEQTNTNNTSSYLKNGVYHSGPHWIANGCNKKGQCTSYYCACCSIRQQMSKQDIDDFLQGTIAGYAGTTSAGTSHNGIETALATIARRKGIKIKVEWKNFSDLGNTVRERFKALGELLKQQNIGIILHTLYKNLYGHYETVQEVNMNNNTCTVLNSLGSKCGGATFCGYTEVRSFTELARNLAGISQKSICIITFA